VQRYDSRAMTDMSSRSLVAAELAADVLEPAFDTLLTLDILKELPVLGSAVKIAELARTVRDRIFTTKVARFVTQVGDLSDTESASMLYELKRDAELRLRVSETVLLILDRLDELPKAQLVAKAFRAYLRQRLSLSDFRRVCQVINAAFLDDLVAFVALPKAQDLSASQLRAVLAGVGLAQSSQNGVVTGSLSRISVRVSPLGELFWRTMNEN
jgi:hypothetical protein